ncbi:Na+/H+ antiporter [Entomophthora muscae]|uniref:Na+/H+ antiporter n=1 Tax=Entomophthora muscae TaxID=34485 RepID=A0ACC2TWT3_9FUNG|nr:Na+/H+ antiporter [Entomophthora muscae]
MGTMAIIGSDDLFCCFVAGSSFNWGGWYRVETEKGELHDVVEMLFNYSFFIYLGTIIPGLLTPHQPSESAPRPCWRLVLSSFCFAAYQDFF